MGALALARLFELILEALRARASYSTRVWTALLLPELAGTALGWSTRMKLEGVLLGLLVAVLYTASQWVWKKYLR